MIEDSGPYVYFATPYPFTRVRADVDAFLDPKQYESYTCLKEGTRLDRPELDRDSSNRLVYAWRRNTPAVGIAEQESLIARGLMKSGEGLPALRDVEAAGR